MLSSGLFLIALAILALVVLAVLAGVLYTAARNQGSKAAQGTPRTVLLRQDSLRASFRQAVELIEANIASRNERYNIPWVLVLSEGEDATRLPISQSGVASMLSAESASTAATQGIAWEFFDRGIVIDLKGAHLGAPDDEGGDEKPWDAFLGLCRTYRPQRPFDSLVLTIPASLLLDDSADAQRELGLRARLAHRRLWLAQNRFAMRFAVYLVISECEHIPGFATFARALPDTMRASMLGWSSPYDLGTQYQTERVDVAFATLLHAVSDIGTEVLALDATAEQASAICMLPSRIDAMREQVRLYTDELMRPSAYHEPFLLRGLYLTGDSSEALQRAAALDDASRAHTALEEDWREPTFAAPGAGAGGVSDGATGLAASSGAPGATPAAARHDLLGELSLQPAFLRDLFERKIFQERGLTRPSQTQHLSRPVLRRGLRWGTAAALGIWGAGIVVAGVQLHGRSLQWTDALRQLHREGVMRDTLLQDGVSPSLEHDRRSVLTLLGLNARFTPVAAAVFLPGAWPVFDDLQERVGARFEQAFGEALLAAVRRGLTARVSQLTGVERDPSTGQLVAGADCSAPTLPSNATTRPPGLNIDDQPAMPALQGYVASVDRLQATLEALRRLQRADTSSEDDLRTVISYTLGAQPDGDLSRALPYFYQHAAGLGSLLDNDVPPIRTAVRCTLDKGVARLDDQLFTHNPLLQADRAVAQGLAGLSLNGDADGMASSMLRYKQIVDGIQTENDLVASGGGAWMRPGNPSPGGSYDRLVTRVGHDALLGQEAADPMRADMQTALAAFRANAAQRFDAPDSGVRWQAKDNRFALSPERAALRDALANLMNQPFMTAPHAHALPASVPGAVLSWDGVQLDQAVALADVRKRYLAEGLAHVAPNVQAALQSAIDAQFAAVAMDQVSGAATPTAVVANADGDGSGFQAALPRLLKIIAFLDELGARVQADRVRATVSGDALQHLRFVDDALNASELYAAGAASGTAGAQPVSSNPFGVHDAAGLAAYLGEQAARAETLGQQAAVYLTALTPTDAASPLAVRWQVIERDLERYKLKNPGSALLRLEQFLTRVGASGGDGSVGNDGTGACMARLGASAPSPDGDYFSQIYQRIWLQWSSRCQRQQTQVGKERWTAFATAFNHQLAGMMPFGARSARAADPGQVAEVLARWRSAAATLPSTTHAGGAYGGGSTVQRFAAQMRAADAFLSPLLPHAGGNDGGPDAAGYDLHVTFRTNRIAESEGNQIIDWSLTSGTQTTRATDAAHVVRWTLGTPLTLTLRLAKNSPFIALNDDAQPALDTDGHVVNYRFSDPWSLLSMLQALHVTEPGLDGDATSTTLRLLFPMAPIQRVGVSRSPGTTPSTDPLAGAAAQRQARVFIRLMMTPAGKQNALVWPGPFPMRAPGWPGVGID